jgi:hypothetical protein
MVPIMVATGHEIATQASVECIGGILALILLRWVYELPMTHISIVRSNSVSASENYCFLYYFVYFTSFYQSYAILVI